MGSAKLTKRAIDAVPIPDAGEVFIWDGETRGFGLRVSATGTRSYCVQYRNPSGRSRRLTLGRHGVLTVDQARDLAKEALYAVAHGIDPAEEKAKRREAGDLAGLLDRYLNEYGPLHLKPSTRKNHAQLARYIRDLLGQRLVTAIDRQDVHRLYATLRKGTLRPDTPTKARGAIEVLARCLSLAEEWGLRVPGTNPCRGFRMEPRRKRQRYLSGQEIARVGEGLQAALAAKKVPASAVLALRLMILTGMRVGEVLSLLWGYVDFERAELRLPDSKTREKVVPLAAPALALLAEAPRGGRNDFVCAGAYEGTGLDYKTLRIHWHRICRAVGVEDARLHDLRHTVASYGVTIGLGLPIVGAILGHRSAKTTARYAHLAEAPVREGVERVGSTLASLLEGEAPPAVVPFRRS